MRKKERYIVNVAAGTAFAFMIIDGISQYIELKEEGKTFWRNLDLNRTFHVGTTGLVIGGSLGYLLYKVQQWEEKELPFCPDNHLHKVLNTYNSQGDPTFVSNAKELTQELKENLYSEFGNDLVDNPIDFGSSKTKTAIGGSSDFDILLPFRKNTRPLLELYEEVHRFVTDNYVGNYFEVRKQRHSIGLTYEKSNICVHVDIVPARERNNYRETGDFTILRRGEGFWETPTHLKTNIWIKRDGFVNQPETRRIIKLIKVYREEIRLPFNSPIVSALVKEAMIKNAGYVNSSIYNNWTLSMAYIADQLQRRVQIRDEANSNNNLLDKTPQSHRDSIVKQIISDLKKLEKSPSYLKEIFQLEN